MPNGILRRYTIILKIPLGIIIENVTIEIKHK